MSYDVWLEIDTGGPEPLCHGSWNYTSNMSTAWREAGADLAEFHGKPAGEVLPALDAAVALMRTDPARFRAFDSPNGWGTHETLVPALQSLADLFRKHPKMIVRVWR